MSGPEAPAVPGLGGVLARLGAPGTLLFLSRAWLLIASPLTLWLIGSRFSPDVQGYHYTFSSLIALQSFFELAFSLVLAQFVAHEWAHLGIDSRGAVTGDSGALVRLSSLLRIALRWYAVAGALFIGIVGTAGYLFLSSPGSGSVSWQVPWAVLVLLTGTQLWLLPFSSLLEGCNQLVPVYGLRLAQSVLSSLFLWAALLLRGQLWVSVVSSAVSVLCLALFLIGKYRRFIASILSTRGPGISWKSEFWPMQWRLMVQSVVVYFAFSMFNPVMFRYHGAAAAGRTGMSWSLAQAVNSLGFAWVQAGAPVFGGMIARKDYDALDRLFYRLSGRALTIGALAAAGAWGVVYLLNVLHHPLASRVLPPLPTGVFLGGMLLTLGSQCISVYFRAHKREPLFAVNVASCVAIGLSAWLLGREYGALGMALGFASVMGAGVLPWSAWKWVVYRKEWHVR